MPEEIIVDNAETVVEQNTITKEDAEQMVQDAVNSAIKETSEKLNSTFQSKFAEIKKEKDEIANSKKTESQKLADEVAEMKDAFAKERAEKIHAINESMARQMLVDADLRVPRTLSRLVGKDAEETKANIQAYIEDRQDDNASAKDKEAKKYGRKIVDTTQKTVEKMSYEDMAKLPDEQFNAIPKDVVTKAMNEALKK